MGGCAAINCRNHSRNGFRMARFPIKSERRMKWIINMRRADWDPGTSAQLCYSHFDESQFEKRPSDGWVRLKPNAVPTIFDFSDKPKYKRRICYRNVDSILQAKSEDEELTEDMKFSQGQSNEGIDSESTSESDELSSEEEENVKEENEQMISCRNDIYTPEEKNIMKEHEQIMSHRNDIHTLELEEKRLNLEILKEQLKFWQNINKKILKDNNIIFSLDEKI